MRTCMVSYSFYESDTRVIQYASALAERGDTVDVYALRRPGQSKFECWKGVNLYRVQERTVNERGPLTYLFRILLFFFRTAFLLSRKHLAKPYQFIHIHSVPDFLVFAAILPKLLGAPVVLDIHDILPEFYASKFRLRRGSMKFKGLLLIEKLSARFSDHVIVANHLWRERLIARSVESSKCTAFWNYPDPKLFYPREKTRSDGKFLLIYPGTLNWHQGLDIAIRAFARVADSIPEAQFHIYGEGPMKRALIDLARELQLNGRVVFHDFLPSEEIVTVMSEADLAVVPKRASSAFGTEAASTKILEFMALGVALIVSATKIDRFYYDDSMVQFFESDSDADLAEKIVALREDVSLRQKLIANGKKYAGKNSWDVKKNEYFRLVDTLTARIPDRVPAEAVHQQGVK